MIHSESVSTWQSLPLLSTVGYRVTCLASMHAGQKITVNDDLAPEPGIIDAPVVIVLTDYVATCYSLLEKNEKEKKVFALPFTYTEAAEEE